MSKFTLSINSDDPADISRIMSAFLSSGAVVASVISATAEADEGAVNTAAPATDSSGLPWDDRIHASTKALKTDGTWRGKRGVSDTLVASVTAELRSRGAVPVPQFAPPAQQPIYPAAPVAPVQQYAQPAAVPQYDPAQYAQPAPVAPQIDFGAFMGGVQRAMTTLNPATGTPYMDQAYIAGFVGRLSQNLQRQLNAITDIHTDPAAIGVAVQMLQAEGRWI